MGEKNIDTSILKKSVILLLTLILLSLLIIMTVSVSADSPIYVNDNADSIWYDSTHVRTIQEAINNASIGTEIFVHNGIYRENIHINKTVSIFGENIADVIITNAEWGDTISVMSSGVLIQNLTIADNPSKDGAGSAIYDESSNSTYNNLNIYSNTYGIYLTSNASGSVITNNYIQNNIVGIGYWYSDNNLIYNNYFDNNRNSEIYTENESIHYWNRTKTPGINIIRGVNLGGNYWSDYTGMDSDGDGIGESVYFVDDSVFFIDFLPLTDKINFPPILENPAPRDGSTKNPLEMDWSIEIKDSEWGIFDWNISCSNGQTNHSSESANGIKTLHLSSLSYRTTYTVWVNVTDYYLWTNETFTFTTKTKGKKNGLNKPPVAIIDGIFVGFPGESIYFDGNQSYDSDGYISSYTWYLGDGTILEGQNITHVYSTPDNYNLTLTVFDNEGASNTTSSNVIIIKANNPPEINLSLEKSPGELAVILTITVDDKDGDNINCIITWGDDSLPTTLQLNSTQTITETHLYTSYGTYKIHVTANDGSAETSETNSLTFSTISPDDNQEGNTGTNGFIEIFTYKDPFLDNQVDSRSILGTFLNKQFVIIVATILNIILLFLLNFLIEFFSDYSSEKTIEYRTDRKSKGTSKKARIVQPSRYLTMKELLAVIVTTLILSFVLTWTWAPDLTIFWETFIIFLIIVVIIILLREWLRSYLCFKQKFHSKYYVWPIGTIMMIVSTFIGNTFSLAANHLYNKGDLKKYGKVSFIVSIVMYVIVIITFVINLFYHSAILQMIVIVSILNLFIDLFPLDPMDGYEIRHWNIFLWASLYFIVIITYVAVYFNLYP